MQQPIDQQIPYQMDNQRQRKSRFSNRWSDQSYMMQQYNLQQGTVQGNQAMIPNFSQLGGNILIQSNSISQNQFSNPIQQNNQVQQINSNDQRKFKNPEEDSAGIISELVKQQDKKFQEAKIKKTPYMPLDPQLAQQLILPIERNYEILKPKIDSFYRFLDEEREFDKKLKKKLEKEKELEREYMEARNKIKPEKDEKLENKKRNIQKEVEDLYSQDFHAMESSINNDGTAMGNYHKSQERAGIGGHREAQVQDVFAAFRKQRSFQYHVTAEERSLYRENPASKQKLCYVCQQPGHIARDCKFGLT